jgi:hypothetical protein
VSTASELVAELDDLMDAQVPQVTAHTVEVHWDVRDKVASVQVTIAPYTWATRTATLEMLCAFARSHRGELALEVDIVPGD